MRPPKGGERGQREVLPLTSNEKREWKNQPLLYPSPGWSPGYLGLQMGGLFDRSKEVRRQHLIFSRLLTSSSTPFSHSTSRQVTVIALPTNRERHNTFRWGRRRGNENKRGRIFYSFFYLVLWQNSSFRAFLIWNYRPGTLRLVFPSVRASHATNRKQFKPGKGLKFFIGRNIAGYI